MRNDEGVNTTFGYKNITVSLFFYSVKAGVSVRETETGSRRHEEGYYIDP